MRGEMTHPRPYSWWQSWNQNPRGLDPEVWPSRFTEPPLSHLPSIQRLVSGRAHLSSSWTCWARMRCSSWARSRLLCSCLFSFLGRAGPGTMTGGRAGGGISQPLFTAAQYEPQEAGGDRRGARDQGREEAQQ